MRTGTCPSWSSAIPAELAAYQSLVSAFGIAHPDIDVELIHIPSPSDYRLRLGADFAAGRPPDVSLINYRRYAALAARGVLEPVEPYLRASQVISERDFYPQAIDPFRWRGELMCLPQNISSLVVYVNRDLLAAAGVPLPEADWTWDEFLAAAQGADAGPRRRRRHRPVRAGDGGLAATPGALRLAERWRARGPRGRPAAGPTGPRLACRT